VRPTLAFAVVTILVVTGLVAVGAPACSSSGRATGDAGAPHVPADLAGCTGRGCAIPACAGRDDTVITGTVFAPNGVDPVPNASVYIPLDEPLPYSGGVACDLCGTVAGALTTTVTRADGLFRLTGVPAGQNIPLVVELGRFRRVVRMNVTECTTNLVPKDPNLFGLRLPGKDADLSPDDHVPHIAVASGDFDQIECVLKRMGISQIDLYDDREPGTSLPATLGKFGDLIADRAKLKSYNLVVINCTKAHFETLLTPAVLANLEDYVASGGRLFATDWAYDFIHQVPEFAPYLCFVPGGVNGPSPATACGGAPGLKGEAHSNDKWNTAASIKDPTMKSWLSVFPNTIVNGLVPVAFNFVVINRVGDANKFPTTIWADGDATDPASLPQFSKGTRPLTVTFDYKQCGRVHYSTYNTEPNAAPNDVPMSRYPMCDNRTTFNAQERLLEYLIFETAQCVGPIE
jgi:hypothetical protein